MTSFDHRLVSQRYFFPRSGFSRRRVDVEVNGVRLACADHRVHGGDAPVLLHFHGNGEIVGDYDDFFVPELQAAGLDVFLVEYRGYGGSTGEATLVAMLEDGAAVWDAVGLDPARVVVYGRSVGAIYALHAAWRRGPAGLILESGVADPLARVLLRVSPAELGVSAAQLQAEAAAHLDHRAKIGALACPVLMLHAAHDDLVDPSHAERHAAWARDAELVLLPRGDHNTVLDAHTDEIVEAVARFAKRVTGS